MEWLFSPYFVSPPGGIVTKLLPSLIVWLVFLSVEPFVLWNGIIALFNGTRSTQFENNKKSHFTTERAPMIFCALAREREWDPIRDTSQTTHWWWLDAYCYRKKTFLSHMWCCITQSTLYSRNIWEETTKIVENAGINESEYGDFSSSIHLPR